MLTRKTVGDTEPELAAMRRLNKVLARLPRFRIRHQATRFALQGLLKLGQLRGDAILARHGLKAEDKTVTVEGASVALRIIHARRPPKAVVLDIHGGAWVIGNAQMNDALNLGLIQACDVTVVSVDYRLAPATTVQGQIRDCLAAARWVLGPANPAFAGLPVVVVGESAGAHLATACLLELKAQPELLQRVCGALLYYGVYDLTGTPSVRNAGPDTLVLDGPGIVAALRQLTPGLTDDQRRAPPLSPLHGDLQGLPPALFVVGERDALIDDTLLMAQLWGEVTQAEVWVVREAVHGFIHFGVGQQVVQSAWAWIRQATR
ncbi:MULTISPECIES: alpha/beta hydrolase fold domain-containing protein [unclassified Pseudomonas]|uniref:alpha/beta hydrolase fold domain-containing protein n=1 Tax=unclassified Pseudomonas TaxID=196821 RepID=UPI000BDAFB1D|nr:MULTISPECIES: alpha/beta hydrolase fold domain-containing protein [unclassified Pseudomonas]PVZ20159.1 acetyl esterase/lipase [Pseudomonas sp. URIL14HWK12:I12]PVZ27225.1 acetyl esterase/lipase [Pseudomonas sp. URIL14HWK12:I10]PVZ38114.1 acetyl esterase/lipase [Pseudomonas sp. URIL14HWK12:I11]SNZ04518.1 Acetyl esterase/lipase [Pseudomonas sp. URIL14HWK12:I9]